MSESTGNAVAKSQLLIQAICVATRSAEKQGGKAPIPVSGGLYSKKRLNNFQDTSRNGKKGLQRGTGGYGGVSKREQDQQINLLERQRVAINIIVKECGCTEEIAVRVLEENNYDVNSILADMRSGSNNSGNPVKVTPSPVQESSRNSEVCSEKGGESCSPCYDPFGRPVDCPPHHTSHTRPTPTSSCKPETKTSPCPTQKPCPTQEPCPTPEPPSPTTVVSTSTVTQSCSEPTQSPGQSTGSPEPTIEPGSGSASGQSPSPSPECEQPSSSVWETIGKVSTGVAAVGTVVVCASCCGLAVGKGCTCPKKEESITDRDQSRGRNTSGISLINDV